MSNRRAMNREAVVARYLSHRHSASKHWLHSRPSSIGADVAGSSVAHPPAVIQAMEQRPKSTPMQTVKMRSQCVRRLSLQGDGAASRRAVPSTPASRLTCTSDHCRLSLVTRKMLTGSTMLSLSSGLWSVEGRRARSSGRVLCMRVSALFQPHVTQHMPASSDAAAAVQRASLGIIIQVA